MQSECGDGRVNRRVALALASFPLLGLRKAEAMTQAEKIADHVMYDMMHNQLFRVTST